MIKKLCILLIFTFLSVTFYGQKSIIDVFLEQNPDIKERATTCINITPEILCTCYDLKSALSCLERYQSLSMCDAELSIPRFEEMIKTKKYEEILSLSEDDGSIVKYFQRKSEKKGDGSNELIVYMKYHNDLTVLYLKGVNLSSTDLENHLNRIKECIEKKEYLNKDKLN
ncbi:MAG: DUF4252 domain-containing protein [Bacteroidales bacterium]|jgi:hypothetical protein|nr:DUF4252 domain-containing protein [Bacteroidales bacterium]